MLISDLNLPGSVKLWVKDSVKQSFREDYGVQVKGFSGYMFRISYHGYVCTLKCAAFAL